MGQAEQMMHHWLRHRHVLEELLGAIPDEHINFKPWDRAMRLGELAQHIAASALMFVSIVKTGERKFKMPGIVECTTMEEVGNIVREYTEKTEAIYASLSDEDLETLYDSPHPNFHGPRKKILGLVNDHEVHHKGQLFVYARMVGVKRLPFFV